MKRKTFLIGCVVLGAMAAQADVSVWSGDNASIAEAANWTTVAGGDGCYLINTNLLATLGAGETFETSEHLFVGRGYGANSEGVWGTSTKYDAGANLTVNGGTMTVNNTVWVGGGFADFYDSIFTINGGSVTVSSLQMGDCASSAEKQDHAKLSKVSLTGGNLAVTGDMQIGQYEPSTNEVNLTGGTMTVGGVVRVGDGGAGVLNLDGCTFGAPTEIMIGLGKGRGTLNVNQDQNFKTFHIGRDGGTGVVNINAGTSVFEHDIWYNTMNLCWGENSKGYLNIASGATVEVKTCSTRVGAAKNGYGELNNNGQFTDAHEIRVGSHEGATGVVNNAGIMQATGVILVGAAADTTAIVNNSGTLKSDDAIYVCSGKNATGTLNITGGYVEVGAGREFRLCENSNTTARCYVTGGALVNRDAWFCVGRSNHSDTENFSKAYLEINGGAVSNITDSCNFTIGTLGSSSCTSEVRVVSGELYAGNNLYVGEIHQAKMTVEGGYIFVRNTIETRGQDGSELIINGGVVEAGKFYKRSHGTVMINGGTIRANRDEGNYFDSLDDMTLGAKGMIFDTAGYTVNIGNKIIGKLQLASGTGVLTLAHGDNASCEVSPVVTGAGAYQVAVKLGTATKATYSADGLYRLAWSDPVDNVYTVTATAEKIESATWTNATGDGDVNNAANWSAMTEDGLTVAAVPTADTAVSIPAADRPDLSGITVKSVTMSVAAGTTYLRGDCTVPAAMAKAVAWYDPDDAATLTFDAANQVVGLKNKGTAAETLDLVAYNMEDVPDVDEAWSMNGRGTLVFKDKKGFKSRDGLPIDPESTVTLFGVSRRSESISEGDNNQMFAIQLNNGTDWSERGLIGLAQWPWYARNVVDVMTGDVETPQANVTLEDLWNDPEAAYIMNLVAGPTAASSFQVRKNDDGTFETKVSAGKTYTARGPVENAQGLSYVAVGMRRENPCGSKGTIGETMIFTNALTEAETAAITDYLKAKWYTPFEKSTIPANLALAENATVDFGGGNWTFASVSGTGTIQSADVTLAGSFEAGLTVDGVVTFGAASSFDCAALLARPIGTEQVLLTADAINGSPTFANADGGTRRIRVRAVTNPDGTVSLVGVVRSKGFMVIVK